MTLKTLTLAIVAGLAIGLPAANAAELRVLSAGAVEPGIRPALAAFEKTSGHTVQLSFATAPQIRERVAAGAAFDVVIAPPAVLDELEAVAKIAGDRSLRVTIGRVGIGVAVRPGAPRPDIATPEAFKRALVEADSLVFNRASTGLYVDTLLKRLGVDAQAKSTRYPDGASVMAHVLRGQGREIGLGAITEILLVRDQGLQFVGPLPPELQNDTAYAAASATGAVAGPAQALLQHLASAGAQAMFATAGIDAPRSPVTPPLPMTHSSLALPRPLASAAAAAVAMTTLITPAFAQAPETPTLEHCAAIGAAPDRLACYDKLAGRAPAPTTSPAQTALPSAAAASAPPTTSLLAAKDAPLPDTSAGKPATSLLSKYWELDAEDKRGIFNFVGYQPNYVLPIHYTNRINRAPQSPTQAVVAQPDYRREEAKFQLSLRTKLAQDLVLPGGDLWVAFTQQAMWQIYNGADSKPFRNTDYQPEATYVLPTAPGLRELPFGWQWRYTQVGLAHQSNGQSDPLSRSWNRVYLGAGFERGDWSLTARINQRLNEPVTSDNNPDLVTYRGRAEFQLGWASGLQTASLLYRTTLTNAQYGSLQFEWTHPVFRDQPNGLRWFVQAFSGYGETLTDYNFRQTSLGLGVTFLQF